MEFKELIAKRRSIRRFSEQSVPHEVLKELVDMALTAPSARNNHSTRFIVVSDPEVVHRIAEMRDYGASFMTSASAAIVVMGDTSVGDTWVDNACISATFLQLAAVELSLSSCWVHVSGRPRRKDEPQGETAEEYLRTFLPIPDECSVKCVIALGYSDFEPKPIPEWNKEAVVTWR